MTRQIKTDSETLNLVLRSLYVNEVWENGLHYEEFNLPVPRSEED
jgi:hypothetical protein